MRARLASKKKKFAVFDIDGTIFRSSLLIELTDALIAEKIFSPRVGGAYARARENWLDRKGDYKTYIGSVIDAFEEHIKGVKYADFLRVADKVIAGHKNRTYRYTKSLVGALKNRDYYVMAISHSPKALVDKFCRQLGFNKVYGMIYGLDEKGRFDGSILFRDLIFNKDKVLERAIKKENLALRDSVGVGDTESDIPFLEIVKNPVCFNPNKKLYDRAKREGWKVVVERKDMIYKNILGSGT